VPRLRWSAARRTLAGAVVEEVVPEAGIEPARPRSRGIFMPLRLSPPAWSCSWSGARLHHSLAATGARRLLSTPSANPSRRIRAWLGVGSNAIDARSGACRAFTEFDGRHLRGFPWRAQIASSPLCLPISPLGLADMRDADPTYLEARPGVEPEWTDLQFLRAFSNQRLQALLLKSPGFRYDLGLRIPLRLLAPVGARRRGEPPNTSCTVTVTRQGW
jgi:hypothetical protein